MEKLKRQTYNDTSPIIKVYLTDAQFKELKQELKNDFKDELVRAIARDEIERYDLKAPYLKQNKFAEWIGESASTVNELKAKGLPVSYALGTVRYGKQSYIDFMKQHERQKGIFKMNKLDIADEIATYTNQLDNIAELMLINLNNSDISKSKELDRLYFLNDYIKELSNQLYNFSNEIIKE